MVSSLKVRVSDNKHGIQPNLIMAYTVTAFIAVAYVVMAYLIMAYTVTAHIAMAYVVTAHVVLALDEYVQREQLGLVLLVRTRAGRLWIHECPNCFFYLNVAPISRTIIDGKKWEWKNKLALNDNTQVAQ